MKHEGKIRLINKNKKACLSLLLAALMIFSNAQAGFCQGWFSKREDNSKTWENIQSEIKALKEKVAQQEQMQSELSVLQEKVAQLENTVKEQAALIAD